MFRFSLKTSLCLKNFFTSKFFFEYKNSFSRRFSSSFFSSKEKSNLFDKVLLQKTNSQSNEHTLNLNFDSTNYKDQQYYRLKNAYKEITYFVTGKKNSTFKDYLELTEEDFIKESRYLFPTSYRKEYQSLSVESRPKKNSSGENNSLSIFSGRYYFFDALYRLESTYEEICSKHPKNESFNYLNSSEKPTWLRKKKMEEVLQGPISDEEHEELLTLLNKIESDKRSTHMLNILNLYKDTSPQTKKILSDREFQDGNVRAKGSRKNSRAEALIKLGTGHISINGKELHEYFNNMLHRQNVIDPLIVTKTENDFDITIRVRGGGTMGQSEASRLALSKALSLLKESSKKTLDKYRLLWHDNRMVERKKPGKKKARKSFAW